MKKLASRFIIGVMVITAVCTGAFEKVIETEASDEMYAVMDHDSDQSVDCCDAIEHEEKLMAHIFPDEQQKIKLGALAGISYPSSEFLDASGLPSSGKRSPPKTLNKHLKTIVRLE